MRIILLGWVFEVCAKLRVQRTTSHMALSFIDRFFEKATYRIPVTEFQTIGITAVVIAAKMEEVYLPDMHHFATLAGKNNLRVSHLRIMERRILQTLNFRLQPVTLVAWADCYTKLWDRYASWNNLH